MHQDAKHWLVRQVGWLTRDGRLVTLDVPLPREDVDGSSPVYQHVDTYVPAEGDYGCEGQRLILRG